MVNRAQPLPGIYEPRRTGQTASQRIPPTEAEAQRSYVDRWCVPVFGWRTLALAWIKVLPCFFLVILFSLVRRRRRRRRLFTRRRDKYLATPLARLASFAATLTQRVLVFFTQSNSQFGRLLSQGSGHRYCS